MKSEFAGGSQFGGEGSGLVNESHNNGATARCLWRLHAASGWQLTSRPFAFPCKATTDRVVPTALLDLLSITDTMFRG